MTAEADLLPTFGLPRTLGTVAQTSKTSVMSMPNVASVWRDAAEYWVDTAQRTILYWDVMRQRGNQYHEQQKRTALSVLNFAYELIMDGRTLPRPVNYMLVRITPPQGFEIDPRKRPFVIVDPRAGHGPQVTGSVSMRGAYQVAHGVCIVGKDAEPAGRTGAAHTLVQSVGDLASDRSARQWRRTMPRGDSRWLPRLPLIGGYGVAVLFVVAALTSVICLEPLMRTGPMSLLICAISLSAWFGGIGPGLLAIWLSVLVEDYEVLPSVRSLSVEPTILLPTGHDGKAVERPSRRLEPATTIEGHPAMAELKLEDFSAEKIHTFLAAKEREKREAESAAAEHARGERDELRAKFEAEDVPGDALQHVFRKVREAVERGDKEVMVLHFPSGFLPDNGRRINTGSKDWPEHLNGFAARAYKWYVKEMQPRGFRLSASVTDFPDGKPGEIGFFLSW